MVNVIVMCAQFAFGMLPNSATEKRLHYYRETTSLDPDDTIAICGPKLERAKLATVLGREGWHILSVLSVTMTLANHGIWNHA